jgi:hypothetical protein
MLLYVFSVLLLALATGATSRGGQLLGARAYCSSLLSDALRCAALHPPARSWYSSQLRYKQLLTPDTARRCKYIVLPATCEGRVVDETVRLNTHCTSPAVLRVF